MKNINKMKVKNLIFYITIFIGLTSCEKDFIDDVSEIPDVPPQVEAMKLESYYNQKSGIVFRWGHYVPNSNSSNMAKPKAILLEDKHIMMLIMMDFKIYLLHIMTKIIIHQPIGI